ncbi:MAG TPA: isoprenylcysteine carboxylmethyltransferase family protein [Chitinophagales bacterium]|nr:isoprenylcysteine carboxylmethyltransferase family protein [Chitinophagales bacterium]
MVTLVILLLLFGVLHSLLADLRVKQWFASQLGSANRFYRIAYNLLFSLFTGAIVYWLIADTHPQYALEPHPVLQITGILLAIAGAVLMVMSFALFDIGEFTGIAYLKQRQLNHDKLRIEGLYKHVRHPLYFGLIVMLAGIFLIKPTQMYLITVLFLYVYIYIGATLEERKLAQVFGQDYITYRATVKMLIPYIF